MSILQLIMENIRPFVGEKGWNYCVFWKLSEDQRYIELMDCCCGGSENKSDTNSNREEELLFAVNFSCRDVMFQHPRTKPCHLLSHLPSSIPLDSGNIHAQSLISNQSRWLNFSNSCHSDILEEETVETRVLIPVAAGLVELFVDKQVPEDQHLMNFITSQFNISSDQQSIINSNFSPNIDSKENNHKELFQPPVSPATMLQNLNLQDQNNISADQIPSMHSSPMSFFQQFDHTTADQNAVQNLLENANENMAADGPINPFSSPTQGYDQEDLDSFQKSMLTNSSNALNSGEMMNSMEPLFKSKKRQNDDNRSDSVSDCSDQNDDDDNNDGKYRRRNGKGQSKNLEAERKRRKKLNERLYNLRSLVPKITKLDRASILGDAIEYVMELQQHVRELQNELERNVDDEGGPNNDNHSSLIQSEVVQGSEVKTGSRSEHGKHYNNGTHIGPSSSSIATEVSKKNHNPEISTNEKVQQMEPQVEVIQLDGNEFFVKVFCEHRRGGFVKLMEALNSLGLEVTNVNVTSLLSLVLNVFKVERKDSDMVQADHVRDSLLELTRNPPRVWPEMSKAASETSGNSNSNNNGGMENYHPYHHHQHPLHLHSHQMKSHLHHSLN